MIMLTALPGVDSSNYTTYLEKLTNTLNETIGTVLVHYLLFHRIPMNVDVLVHGVNFLTILDNNEDLSNEVRKGFKISQEN